MTAGNVEQLLRTAKRKDGIATLHNTKHQGALGFLEAFRQVATEHPDASPGTLRDLAWRQLAKTAAKWRVRHYRRGAAVARAIVKELQQRQAF